MFSRFAMPIQLKASAAAAVLLICLLALGGNAYLTSTRSAAGLRALSQDLLKKRQAFAAVSDAAVGTHIVRVETDGQGKRVEPQCAARPGGIDPARCCLTPHGPVSRRDYVPDRWVRACQSRGRFGLKSLVNPQ